MDLLFDFPLTSLFVIAVAVWVTTTVARRAGRRAGGATCPRCGAAVPPVARFCRNCGRQV